MKKKKRLKLIRKAAAALGFVPIARLHETEACVKYLRKRLALSPPVIQMSPDFMFKPFRGRVLQAVLDQIRASVIRTPRRLRIAYVLPANEGDVLSECEWLTKLSFLPAGFWTHVKCLLYEVNCDVARLEIVP